MSNSVSTPGFCPNCGSILPLPSRIGNVLCFSCKLEIGPEVFEFLESKYVIYFNTNYKKSKKGENEIEGPVVDRQCPKCGCDKMSYATIQLRSADEGQTVFYTCVKCKFKESENS